LVLPDAAGTPVSLSEKVYVPLKDHPEVNFARIKKMWQFKNRTRCLVEHVIQWLFVFGSEFFSNPHF
jgi:hypothetical protein